MFARKLIKPFFLIVLVIFILFFSIFESLDSTPYKESKFYKQTMFSLDSLDRLNSNIEGDTLKIGWAKSSLIPSFPTPLAGYGERKGKINIGVEDSIWVRTIVLDNGKNRAAYISLDLLIPPPNLNFNDILKGTNLRDSEIFLTASHSHSSIGGYLPSVVGEMFAGEYDEKILKFISGAIRESLLDALNNMEITKVGYSRIKAEEFITNRLVGDSIGAKDNWIRLVKFERNYDKIIDIFGADHMDAYPDVMEVMNQLNYDTNKMKVLIHQFVTITENNKPIKMSTRKANFTTLEELCEEVGADVVRYFFIMRNINTHLNFELKIAKEQSDVNPIFYLQYAHARICTIIRKAKDLNLNISNDSNLNLLIEPSENDLMNSMINFENIIKKSYEKLDPQIISNYLEELAAKFHKYYSKHKVISENKDLSHSRLFLINALRIVIKNGLNVLGIKEKERM